MSMHKVIREMRMSFADSVSLDKWNTTLEIQPETTLNGARLALKECLSLPTVVLADTVRKTFDSVTVSEKTGNVVIHTRFRVVPVR